MGIFRNITKTLKKAAPLIGSAIGMYFGGPLGASIGSGIGSLASGRSAEEALRNAALTGATAYLATGPGTPGAGMKNFDTSGSPLRTMFQGADTSVSSGGIKAAGGESFLSKLIPESTMGKVALLGGIGALAGGIEDPQTTATKMRDFSEGEYRGGKLTTLDDNGNLVDFDGGDPEQRKAYYEQLARNHRRRKEVVTDYDEYGTVTAAGGGEVTGPGTGTSDSVPARLSDGEFVVTARAVRGAGGGDRDVGAARMYDMMSQLERVA
jgi:hypothetical protein